MPESAWARSRRLLVAYVGPADGVPALGPALAVIREAAPNARLTLWASPACWPTVELLTADRLLLAPVEWPEAEGVRQVVAAFQDSAFDAAIILTEPGASPHPVAYACYLAGIPVRAGQSLEFGGSVLSLWVKSRPAGSRVEHHWHLLEGANVAQRLEADEPALATGTTLPAGSGEMA